MSFSKPCYPEDRAARYELILAQAVSLLDETLNPIANLANMAALLADALQMCIRDSVNRVIHDFPKQVVQTAGACRADVHTRTHPNRIQPFKHLEHAGRIGFRHE